jgi:putative hydrolase of HD superfamily
MKKKLTINNLERFTDLLNRFRKVNRVLRANGLTRDENDVEHSYMLAMLGWYIASIERPELDLHKVLMYALAHDLVEVYAGDTFFYHKNKRVHESKQKREYKALQKITKEFSEFKELHRYIRQYEARKDAESKFMYALDKIHPVILIYLDKGHTWKREKITLAMAREMKDHKIKVDPLIDEYWKELVPKLKRKEKKLFYKK